MPLPQEPLTIRGGCHCRAIRYEIDIPTASERPLEPDSDKSIQLPFVLTCHCNDCRRSTAGLALFGLFTPMNMIRVSLVSRTSSSSLLTNDSLGLRDDDAKRDWVPASQVFAPTIAPSDSFLATYKSSEAVYRTFCARCGTSLTCSRYPMPEHWPEMLDILLGTVDRDCLENAYMAPDRHIFWDIGIEWVHRLFNGGIESVIKHPTTELSETVK